MRFSWKNRHVHTVIRLTGLLFVYVLMSMLLLTNYNCVRCSGQPGLSAVEAVAVRVAFPGYVLLRPAEFILHSVATKEAPSFREQLVASGLQNPEDITFAPEHLQPTQKPTALSYVAALIVELFLLVILSAILVVVATTAQKVWRQLRAR